MKLSALNSAIRSLKGAPKVNMRYWRDEAFEVKLPNLEVTKQSLLEALKGAFTEGRNQETHLILIDGVLSRDDATWPISDSLAVPVVEEDDDPLGLGVDLGLADPPVDIDSLLG